MTSEKRTMRDALIEGISRRMATDRRLMFLTADLGAPALDLIRTDYKDRFINVGIAEQNLVNVAAGLALEGFTVYAYAIAPFLVMRAYEQIRNNLALLSHTHAVNVNLIGIGAGLSYDVSGPTHHSIEDIGIMRTLPNMTVFSPSDWVLAGRFAEHTFSATTPKYLRFDGKPLPNIYSPADPLDMTKGFFTLADGEEVCIVSTGYMTHTALRAVETLKKTGIRAGLIDLFLIKPLPGKEFHDAIKGYKYAVTLEEAFIGKGGLDSLVAGILSENDAGIRLTGIGFGDSYVFSMGGRDRLHELNGLGEKNIVDHIRRLVNR